jgi:Domain of unknown function (DUF5658)
MLNLLVFVALQVGDLATTLWFLARGVEEGNPLVATVIRLSSHPAVALAVVKATACALAFLAWRGNRTRLLRRVNLLFAMCVAWNLLAVARATG